MSSSGESEYGASCATSSKSLESPRKLPGILPLISPQVSNQPSPDYLFARSAAARPVQLLPSDSHLIQAGLQTTASEGAILNHMSSSGESEYGASCATSSKSLESPRKLPGILPLISPQVSNQPAHSPQGRDKSGGKRGSRRVDIILPVAYTHSMTPTNLEDLTGKFMKMQS
jgi:hypothetical protein